jgi:hypothetical protein
MNDRDRHSGNVERLSEQFDALLETLEIPLQDT